MYKLVETKLQKVIFLIGGLLIFFRLINVSYYDRYNAILASIGISVLTIVLLILLRNYYPKFHLRIIGFIKKHKRLLICLIIFIFIILLTALGRAWYLDIKEKKIAEVQKEKFHSSEVAYQACLDKVAALTIWKTKPVDKSDRYIHLFDTSIVSENKYFDEWIEANRPNYNQSRGHWEWAFMEWMMEKYPEFCTEYNTDLINYFLDKKF